ncbi:hypothetical protein A3N68_12930 [Enterobacter asburiae]|uniref:tail fiber assembly protein n=1 Tax=Enterobacter asburiae TaxID=61645 RepID=UPI0007B379F8|nr:tail fiber assembly protein [Enterobacter asburiae]ELY2957905.1 tail fiber assembly protein [Cronobacter sakazakii]KZR47719.1 hypothetical protein A3N68_12930 [Enterobacter asburiae]
MDYLYSPSAGGFFTLSDIENYKSAGVWPSDGIEISEAQHDALFPTPVDKVIGMADGKPCWIDAPLPTAEELVAQAEQTRQLLLKRVDEVTADWRVELALGEISEEEKTKLSAWMNYKREIKAVNTSTAPVVKWPSEPGL